MSDFFYHVETNYGLVSLEWTTDKPTKPGLYFVKHKTVDEVLGVYVNIENDVITTTSDYRDESITHWLGPLPIPEPPTVER